jgi:hypothetical protein
MRTDHRAVRSACGLGPLPPCAASVRPAAHPQSPNGLETVRRSSRRGEVSMREVSGAGIRFFAGFNCAASLFASPDAMSAFRHVSDLTPAWLDVGEGQQQSKSTPGEFSLGPVLPPPPTNDRVRRGSFRHGNGVTYSADSKPENYKARHAALLRSKMLAQLAASLNRPGKFPV